MHGRGDVGYSEEFSKREFILTKKTKVLVFNRGADLERGGVEEELVNSFKYLISTLIERAAVRIILRN